MPNDDMVRVRVREHNQRGRLPPFIYWQRHDAFQSSANALFQRRQRAVLLVWSSCSLEEARAVATSLPAHPNSS
jgi:hypothetical protein